MNLVSLSMSYIRARALSSFLSIILFSLGIAAIIVLLLFGYQLRDRMQRDAEGIDLVVGAKGSPLQLILSALYQVDVPTGTISLQEVEKLKRHKLVKQAIPLALVDSYQNFRIIGTDPHYLKHYRATIQQGKLWKRPFEIVLGAEVAKSQGLKVGDKVVSSHGLGRGGEAHIDMPYRVVGVLAKTGTVIDRLLLTSLESVWDIHEGYESAPVKKEEEKKKDSKKGKEKDKDKDKKAKKEENGKKEEELALVTTPEQYTTQNSEVNAVLVTYNSPLAVVTLPRLINSQTNLVAAAPVYEVSKLMSLVGAGFATLQGFAFILILAAGLGVFITLYNAMQERQYDMAVMRSMGASKGKMLCQVLLESMILSLAGTVLGIFLGHVITETLSQLLPEAQTMRITGLIFLPGELALFLLAMAVGTLSALLPAAKAYRTDIAMLLVVRN